MLRLRIVPLFVCFLTLLQTTNAQNQITEFGVFTGEEIDLKECEFDKDADAIVFFDQAKSSYNDMHNLVTERRVRLKILKERGIERGDIHLRYYHDGDFESISAIDATVLSFDNQNKEVWSKLDRKSIYKKKLNKYFSEISFALPNVKVGSIIEYKYESKMENYGGLQDWTFQKEIPVVLSSYHLTIVPNAEFAYTVYKSPEMPITVNRMKEDGAVLFEMRNIPGLREEAYMGAARDYLQRIKFQFSGYKRVEGSGYGVTSTSTSYATTWQALATELCKEPNFGSQVDKTLAGSDILQQEWAKESDPYARMKKIHDFVKSRLIWNQIYSKYADEGVKEVWEKKTGNSGEINLILINLLKTAGLTVHPLLVSERDFGKVDSTYPYVNQFDKVVAYVTIDKDNYILDGTDRQTPTFIVPYKLLNTTGFIVDRKNAHLLPICGNGKKSVNTVTLVGDINETGSLRLEASVDNYNYSKLEKKEKYSSDKKSYEKEFFEPFAAVSVDTLGIDGLESDSLPLHHLVKLKSDLNKSGDYYLLNCNLFTGLNKNPFISEHRFTDINFGCKSSYIVNSTFSLPQNLAAQSLPKSVKLVLPDESMMAIRQVQQSGDLIQISFRIEVNRTEYSSAEYGNIQGFYKKMLELLNEPIVLKAKS
ncbi:MAG TPA: DUF3857 domain-containing protein [Segetibacter sp.]|nr:DUF3857 domain-containing protein [Segetibacter sp.]